MSETTTLKESMSKMLDSINGIHAANTHVDGSYETKDAVIEGFQSQLSILWVFVQTDIEQLQAELDTANEKIERLKGTCMCMDCGKTIRTVEQSNHDKICKVALQGQPPCPDPTD